MNCKVKQGCLTSESCCILLWLAFTLFPVSVVTAADNRKIDESQQKEVKAEMKGYVGDENGEPLNSSHLCNPFCIHLPTLYIATEIENGQMHSWYVNYQYQYIPVHTFSPIKRSPNLFLVHSPNLYFPVKYRI